MEEAAKIDSSEYADLNRVIRWFVRLRWFAASGVLVALLLGQFVLGYAFNFIVLYAILAALFVLNLLYALYFGTYKKEQLSRSETGVLFHVQICGDYSLLFLLLYFTGFIENPFMYYFVFHIMLTAFIFPARTVFYYVLALTSVFLAVPV